VRVRVQAQELGLAREPEEQVQAPVRGQVQAQARGLVQAQARA